MGRNTSRQPARTLGKMSLPMSDKHMFEPDWKPYHLRTKKELDAVIAEHKAELEEEFHGHGYPHYGPQETKTQKPEKDQISSSATEEKSDSSPKAKIEPELDEKSKQTLEFLDRVEENLLY